MSRERLNRQQWGAAGAGADPGDRGGSPIWGRRRAPGTSSASEPRPVAAIKTEKLLVR
jgi:hypothetical protein